MLSENEDGAVLSCPRQPWLTRALSIEWMGQTAASLFWISSVFSYGITTVGDWLQLFAASAWLVSNLATLARADDG